MPIDVIGNKRENESWKRDRGGNTRREDLKTSKLRRSRERENEVVEFICERVCETLKSREKKISWKKKNIYTHFLIGVNSFAVAARKSIRNFNGREGREG